MVRHEQLWAPWRLAYVSGESNQAIIDAKADPGSLLPGGDPHCFICRAVAQTNDRENLVVERSESSAVLLNRYPYNNGHLLVVPLLHKGRLDELTGQEVMDSQRLLAKYVDFGGRLLSADGFNIGLNLGRAAGAGVPGHLHWHLVPRWQGDTNFMPTVAGVKVIAQSLDALWELYHKENSP